MQTSPWERLQGWGLYVFTELVWRTARYHVVGLEHFEETRASGRPILSTAWHGMTMVLGGFIRELWSRVGVGGVLIIPDDHRRPTLSYSAKRLGLDVYPISMQATTMVAARRLLAVIRELQKGKVTYLAPDGPDGPSHVPKDGIAYIVRKSNAVILPGAAFTETCYRRRRWDRYMIPFPLSRITAVFGEPIDLSVINDQHQALALLTRRLNEVEETAKVFHKQTT